jgi:hypothetical protein
LLFFEPAINHFVMAITAAEATVRHTTLHCVLVCISCPHEVGAMSSQVELCEHHAKDCLQAAEKTEDPLAREMLLRNALEWLRDGLAASKQSKLCRVCGRKAAPGSSLVH